MRILLDQGVYDLRNKGNVALLQVAVRRLRAMWPAATLDVMTLGPQVLRLYCPEARAIRPDSDCAEQRSAGSTLWQLMPTSLLRVLLEVREFAWRVRSRSRSPATLIPGRAGAALANEPANQPIGPMRAHAVGTSLGVLSGADLLVATGAQYMSDACKDDALRVLDRFEGARQRGIPTAMLGQGVGPFDDPELRARARAVYPLVDLIFIRDRLTAPPLLSELGVDSSRVVFTGDDAIELAYARRRREPGAGLGVSLRIARYTDVAESHVRMLRNVLWDARVRFGTALVPIPISYSSHEVDERVLRGLVGEGSAWVPRLNRFQQPEAVIENVGRCRVVVTGTFHAAVFALAQGIPVVSLGRTRMYLDKFRSLADQFDDGCQVIDLDTGGVESQLARAIDTAWRSATALRPRLLQSAERHITLAQAAYHKLYDLVASGRTTVAR